MIVVLSPIIDRGISDTPMTPTVSAGKKVVRRSCPPARSVMLLLCIFLLMPSGGAFAQTVAGADLALQNDLETILGDGALSSANVGIVVESLTTDRRLYEKNGRKRFIPASNMKLFTSAAALLALSPDFRFETGLFTAGSLDAGVLRGDLVIKASGDPTISGYFNGNNPLSVFQQWTSKLKEAGITEIRGNLVIDNSVYAGRPFGTGWEIDDITSCFSAPKDAFTFNNNCIQLEVTPGGRSGDQARIVMEPVTDFVRLGNHVATHSGRGGDAVNFEYTSPRKLEVNGTVVPGSRTTTHYIPVHHPAHFGGFVFKETLASGGIIIKGDIVCARNCPRTAAIPVRKGHKPEKRVAVYQSPNLSEIIKVVNKISNNLYAELLLTAIGKTAGNASTTEESIGIALAFLSNGGIDTSDITMADGSGLSRHNLVTPHSVIQLLKVMAKGPYSRQFTESLPAMSIDGTLKNRLKGSIATGRVRGKTGTMRHARGLSGYITARNNETLAFSILINNHSAPVSTIDDVINRIILRLLDYPSETN